MHRLVTCVLSVMLAFTAVAAHAQAGGSGNVFNDPFVQVTSALPGCPVPQGPSFTPEEVRNEAHVRSQHGGSCYRAGRCRLKTVMLVDDVVGVVNYLMVGTRGNPPYRVAR